jgi:subtilisin family serine protease
MCIRDSGNRVLPGYDATTNTTGKPVDCNGHGTAVASVVASTTYGVAKKASIIPVRVTDCNGWATGANLTRGLNWILNTHKTGTPGIVNISLGSLDPAHTPGYAPQDNAVANLVRKGLFVTISAGNDSTRTWSGTEIASNTVIDACQASPARVTGAFTVGAFDPLVPNVESRSAFSNAGSCIDAWAPGVDVKALTRSGCKSSWYGTSFSAPIAAGLAALTLGQTPKATPAQVTTTLLNNGQSNALANTSSLPLDATHRYTTQVGPAYLVKASSASVNVVLRAPQ